jgi:hypothetical protein
VISGRCAGPIGRRAFAVAAIGLMAFGCARTPEKNAPTTGVAVREAYARSTAALMWPGATRAFQITPSGDLYNGEWRVLVQASVGGSLASSPEAIAYEDGWRPIARWERANEGVIWSFEAVALPGPATGDSALIVSLVVRATNSGTRRVEANIAFVLAPPDTLPEFVALDAPSSDVWPPRWSSTSGKGLAHGWADRAAHGDSVVAAWSLAPSERREMRVLLATYPEKARALAAWARPPHDERVRDARERWDAEIARGLQLELHDPEVEAAVRAAEVVLLSCRERSGPHWVPIGSPFHYRDVWLRDGARAIQALALAGYVAEAREAALGLTNLRWPNGAYLSQRGQLDGTGQMMWACGEAFLRPSAREAAPAMARDVTRAADAAYAGWQCLERERALGRATGLPYGALLPYGDPHDNELVRAQLVGNDAWSIAGYRAAARLLAAAGRTREAARVDSSLQSYLADFSRALGAQRRTDIPPSWQGIGRDWGNLAAAYPCGAVAISDARVATTARRVWAEAGGAGLVTYGDRDSLHAYLGADLGTWALLAGHREQADSVLAAMLHWRTASGGAGEIFSRTSRDFGRNLPPHPTSAAALITLVRNALIEDSGDTLRLTFGARDSWWAAHGVVRHAPTRWGMIDLEFSLESDAASWKWTPVPVWTELRLPSFQRFGSAPAPLRPGRRPEIVLAPPGTSEARVLFAVKAGERR